MSVLDQHFPPIPPPCRTPLRSSGCAEAALGTPEAAEGGGARPQGGDEFAFDENAGPARRPTGFQKNIGMALNGLQGASREIRIHLPGKTPAWRYIAKAKGCAAPPPSPRP